MLLIMTHLCNIELSFMLKVLVSSSTELQSVCVMTSKKSYFVQVQEESGYCIKYFF